MSCECHRIGGPFIAEDPDCVVHGRAADERERQVEALRKSALSENDPAALRRIIDDLAYIACNL